MGSTFFLKRQDEDKATRREMFQETPGKAAFSSVLILLSTHKCPVEIGLRILYFHCTGHMVGNLRSSN